MRMNRRTHRRGGFSLIELLMAMSILGILAGLVLPNLRNVTWRARAVEVASDVDVVGVSVNQYNADQSAWPAEAGLGEIPPGLEPFLPVGFSFQRNGYTLDFERLAPISVPGDPSITQLIAVAVVVETDELSNAVLQLLESSILYSVGRKHTFMIVRN